MSDSRPIGIYDSGIGGLTVAHAIQRTLPNENIIYFGDTAHVPYGDKSAASIRHYSHEITAFLKAKNCKAVIIACNTASSFGFSPVRKSYGADLLILDVVSPIADYIGKAHNSSKVGVIGTKGTIGSRVYPRAIKKRNKTIQVTQLATPLLAPMIEEGFFNNNISQTIINNYLSKKNLKKIDALVLGCTHYPLIKNQVLKFYEANKKQVEILDSAEIVAKKLSRELDAAQLLNKIEHKAQHQFYVSDYTRSFEKSTRIFFKDRVHLKEARIWD